MPKPEPSPKERYCVTLEAKADDDDPTCVRLKKFLKAAFRQWGLRCLCVAAFQRETFEGGEGI